MVIRADGFIESSVGDFRRRFTKSPVPFFKTLFTIVRRNGMSIDKSQMGQVLLGVSLAKKDFE
jgi:hypothetical protein